MNETQRRFLRRLRDAQPRGLQRSSIPKSCAALVESLQTCGIVEFQRAPSGRGIVLAITNEQAFQRFICARLPHGLDVDLAAIPDRAAAVVMLADAKAIRRGVGQGIFIRSTRPGTEVRSIDGEISISVSQLTAEAGGIGVQLSPTKSWTFTGQVAVVENEDAFWQHEIVLPDVDVAVLGGGNMSRRLLHWLASPAMSRCHLTYWGDYDPVGVFQYLRLADACPSRVTVYAPPEVDELLRKHGKRKLIIKQASFLDRLRRRASDPYVHRMIDLFDRHRRGLEQEALLRPDLTSVSTEPR